MSSYSSGPESAKVTPTGSAAVANSVCSPHNPAPGTTCRQESVKALFVVTGPSDPGLLPRVIEPVAKLGIVPSRVHASCEAGDGSEMTIDLRLDTVDARMARQVEISLRAIVCTRQVFAVFEPVC